MKQAPPAIICCKHHTHIKKYLTGRRLGVGGFASVYSVESLDSSKLYACKVINKSILKRKEHQQKLISEIRLHRSLAKHENIVTFERYFDDNNNVYILLEMCTNQSLMELIRTRHTLTEYEVRYFMKQILNGVKFLHKQNVIHRDLKLGNLLCDKNLNIKICDFGLATLVEHSGVRKTTICGTPNYIAPEILNQKKLGQGHSYEVDIWSLGVIMFTLLTGKPPFETKNIQETYRRIKKINYKWPTVNNHETNISFSAKDLVSKILNVDPVQRPNLFEIEQHDFFTKTYIPKQLPLSILNRQPTNITNIDKLKTKSFNNQPKINIYDEFDTFPSKKTINTRNNDFIFVVKHCDYSKKYGIGYILSNGFTGIYFNDSTKMTLHRNKNSVTYIDAKNNIKYCSFNNFPSEIAKKVKLLQYFNDYLWNKSEANNLEIEKIQEKLSKKSTFINNCNEDKVYVGKYLKEKYAMLFCLTNHTMQVNFADSSKLIFQDLKSIILYQDKNGNKQIYTFQQISQSNKKDLKKRFKYSQQLRKRVQSKTITTNHH